MLYFTIIENINMMNQSTSIHVKQGTVGSDITSSDSYLALTNDRTDTISIQCYKKWNLHVFNASNPSVNYM